MEAMLLGLSRCCSLLFYLALGQAYGSRNKHDGGFGHSKHSQLAQRVQTVHHFVSPANTSQRGVADATTEASLCKHAFQLREGVARL